MNRRLGIALIGLGPAAQPHAKSLLDLKDEAKVLWANSRNPDRGRAFAEQFGFPFTTDLNQALSDEKVDAVFILTPPSSHLELASLAFEAGKHVLLEKPIDITIERGEAILRKARSSGPKLGIVLQHRFRPASKRLKNVLRNGDLGDVQGATLSIPWWRPQSYYGESGRGTFARDGGGVLLTQAIHAIDLFRDLLGIRQVDYAHVRTTGLHDIETEDLVNVIMTLSNGATASLWATTSAYPGSAERLEIIGTKGTACLSGGRLEVSYISGQAETVEAEGKSGSGAAIMDFPHDAHRALIADFCAAIVDDREPLVTGTEALDTQRLITDILGADRGSSRSG